MAAALQQVVGDPFGSGRTADVAQAHKQQLLAHGSLDGSEHFPPHYLRFAAQSTEAGERG
jgi:hypothetical protein